MNLNHVKTSTLLQTKGAYYWEKFSQLEVFQTIKNNQRFMDTAQAIWSVSDYAAQLCFTHPAIVVDLFESQDIEKVYDEKSYEEKLSSRLQGCDSQDSLMGILRKYRHREMLRILWRSLSGWSDTKETLRELSSLADAILQQTLTLLHQQEIQRWDIPQEESENIPLLMIIAVGKLGGKELNFSSDIDLIFCFPYHGEVTSRGRKIPLEKFYNQLAQQFIKTLNDVTAEGFVYRVDMRLRPYGNSGPLVCSITALETYYQTQGREWERYALVKARLIVSESPYRQQLQKMLKSFVYRRYIDFSVIDALRGMKDMIHRQTRNMQWENDIKRASGGIREIEFITQAFQLIRGGKEPYLQSNEILSIFPLLIHVGLEQETITQLREAYLFLRDVENCLQMMEDRQTQTLPADALNRERLACVMNYKTWEFFLADLEKHQEYVKKHFQHMIVLPEKKNEEQKEKLERYNSLWEGRLIPEDFSFYTPITAEDKLENIHDLLEKFRQSRRIKSISKRDNERLNHIIPYLLARLFQEKNPAQTLNRLLRLLDNIIHRSAYFSLLMENPQALNYLVTFFSQSEWVSHQITAYPILLDELLDPRLLNAPFNETELENSLDQRLLSLPEEDVEMQMEVLREFKHEQMLRVAVMDLMERLSVEEVGQRLALLAVTILKHVQHLAWQHVVERWGYPQSQKGPLKTPQFGIVAYGKLGSGELGYGSDLDLVFLFESEDGYETAGKKSITHESFYYKLAQRMVYLLGLRTFNGILYETDIQLRPSGNAGLLVSRLSAYEEYQHSKAWTWEHQALVRARLVVGTESLAQGFNAIRTRVLTQKREESSLKQQLQDMRRLMISNKKITPKGFFDIKNDRGGVTDVEFMVQFWVLSWAYQYPKLLKATKSDKILTILVEEGIITLEVQELLGNALETYQRQINRNALQEQEALVPEGEWGAMRKSVTDLWTTVFE